jgi:hypothetical protein
VPCELAPWSPRNTADDLALFEQIALALSNGDGLSLEGDLLTIRAGEEEVRRFTRPAHLKWRLISFV